MDYSQGLYQWQKERLLAKRYPGAGLVKGYGLTGEYSLYLPSPNVSRRFIFRNGKPEMENESSCFDLPHILELRNRVLSGTPGKNPLCIIYVDSCLVEYSAALLATQYKFTDDELTMLHSGTKWHDPLIGHALGGKDVIETIGSLDSQWVDLIRHSTVQKAMEVEQAVYGMPSVEFPEEVIVEESEDLLAMD